MIGVETTDTWLMGSILVRRPVSGCERASASDDRVNDRAFRDASEKQELREVYEAKPKDLWEGTMRMVMTEGQHLRKQTDCRF